MRPINKNWTDTVGQHIGGQSLGDNFTIAWQRGSLDDGRNGAFLIEVLGSCLDWIRLLGPCHMISGVGFTISFGGCVAAFQRRLNTLMEVLEACLSQVRYYQARLEFACNEYSSAEGFLVACLADMKEPRHLEKEWTAKTFVGEPTLRESVLENVESALKCIVARRDRGDRGF